MSSAVEDLATVLRSKKKEWPPGQNTYFIPINEVHHRMKEEELAAFVLKRQNSSQPFSCGSNQSFCSKILDFLENNVTDEDLPLIRLYFPGSDDYTLGKKKHKYCNQNHDGDCGMYAVSSWKQHHIQDLSRDQWLALAPIFKSYEDHVEHYDLEGSTILPYIRDQQYEPGAVKSGGYSRVWGVEIHPAHQKLLPVSDSSVSRKSRKKHRKTHKSKGPTIAVKQLNSPELEDFDREYEMLSKLALTNDPHLIRLLATYKFNNQYHFLFPYANLNLKRYWKHFQLDWEKKEVFWVIQQLRGLASALHVIHEFKTAEKFPLGSDHSSLDVSRRRPAMNVRMQVDEREERFGRHGDLKPENILWFKSFEHAGHAGILQITDLGLGRFHRLESRSKQDPKDINGSPTYVPPELALQKFVSRSYDIWSFGCVLLEFITWMLDGNAGVDAFADARMALAHDNVVDDTFYTVYSPGPGMYATVRPEVTAWIQRLRGHRRYSPMIRDLLDLVENGMLQADTADRIKSKGLKDTMEFIVKEAEKHPSSYMLARVE